MVARSERLAGLPRWGGTRVRNIEISWSTMAVPLCAPAFSATRSEPLFLFCCLQHCCASTRSNHSFDFHNSVNLMLHKQVITHTWWSLRPTHQDFYSSWDGYHVAYKAFQKNQHAWAACTEIGSWNKGMNRLHRSIMVNHGQSFKLVVVYVACIWFATIFWLDYNLTMQIIRHNGSSQWYARYESCRIMVKDG